MDLTREAATPAFLENQTTIRMSFKSKHSNQRVTSEDFGIEYQNQIKLSDEGLEFTLELYKNEANLFKWVSIYCSDDAHRIEGNSIFKCER